MLLQYQIFYWPRDPGCLEDPLGQTSLDALVVQLDLSFPLGPEFLLSPTKQRNGHRQQDIRCKMDYKTSLEGIMFNQRARCQPLSLPWLPSDLASLLSLQDLHDPEVEKDKIVEITIRSFDYHQNTHATMHMHANTTNTISWADPSSRRSCGTWLSRGTWRSLQRMEKWLNLK